MRVCPIGFAFSSLEEVMIESRRSALVTHNHRQGIIGAQAVACVVFLASNNKSKDEIKSFIQQRFKYNLKQRLDDIRPNYTFDLNCQH
ncbi:ADP-ribosylglycohydrolase [Paenibacillus sp. V4I9]|uniref:ADP-ribosylglycohydrolase family protein n=1 Tax=Paenibacillus sp. V4I9 TaxID=3042308 RepID=UPI002783E043|nr:ADP-ribosylglycohydrolase [Paenibacillus sp. V4I9]